MRRALVSALAHAIVLGGLVGSAAAEAPATETTEPVAPAAENAEPTSAVTQQAPAEVLVVLGSTEGNEVDPALSAVPALAKAPFDSFTQKKLLSKTALALKANEAAEVELPNGRKLRLVWLGMGEGGRYRMQVSINRPGKKDYLPLLTVAAAAGDPFFVAGQSFEGGTLIIGVRVGQPKAG